MSGELAGKVVVLTGGAGGLGRSLSRRFGTEGAEVVLLDLEADALDAAVRHTGAALGLTCDVTDPAECDRTMAQIIDRFGGIDVLVNNAGISHRSQFLDTDPGVLRKVMEVNFFGAVNCTRAALPALLESRGRLAAISSVAGFAPLIGRTGYAASKHALHGFFDSLRTELSGTGVSVLLACPAFTATGIRKAALTGCGEPYGDQGGAPRNELDPDEVAAEIAVALRKRRRTVRIGRLSRASWWVSRLAPAAYDLLMRRSVRA